MSLIDLHCDTLSALYKNGEKASLTENDLCVNIKGLRQGNSLAQFFACYVNAKESEGEEMWEKSYQQVLGMIDRMEEECGKCPDIRIAKNASQIRENQREGRISAVLTVEEGGVLNGKPERIRTLYEKGIRLITLTWNYENSLAGSHMTGQGLSARGAAYVRAAQQLGMLVDVSHASDEAFWQVCRMTQGPILASHSNSRAVCPESRNVTDGMYAAICETGGVVGLNFYTEFLGRGQVDFETVWHHLDHFLQLAGDDRHVALGADLDGCDSLPDGFTGVASYPALAAYLADRGLGEETLRRLYFENLMGVYRQCMN